MMNDDIKKAAEEMACMPTVEQVKLRQVYSTATPIHEHDCDQCKPLGQFNGQDLYYCDQKPFGWTLISRFGKHGDYCSGGWKTENKQMVEARRRAIAAGYVKEGEYS